MYEWQIHKTVVRELMKLMDDEWLCPAARRVLSSKMFPCEPKNIKSIILEQINE